jgi:hypothetical protein
MTTTKLLYKDKIFVEPVKSETAGAIAVLELNDEAKKAVLTFTPETTLIDRRTSERQAKGICKSGFLLQGGKRVGMGCDLEVSSQDVITDRLLQSGHQYK